MFTSKLLNSTLSRNSFQGVAKLDLTSPNHCRAETALSSRSLKCCRMNDASQISTRRAELDWFICIPSSKRFPTRHIEADSRSDGCCVEMRHNHWLKNGLIEIYPRLRARQDCWFCTPATIFRSQSSQPVVSITHHTFSCFKGSLVYPFNRLAFLSG